MKAGTTAAHLSDVTLRQLAALFDAIASKAAQIDQLCFFGTDSIEHLHLTLDMVRSTVNQMGLIADLGAAKLDGYGIGVLRGGAEEWLLPPNYPKPAISAEVEGRRDDADAEVSP